MLLQIEISCRKDFINLKPDYIVLEIGVNDAWNLYKDKATFEKTYKALLDTLTSKTTAKIILVEPFLLPANEAMKKVCPIENIDNYHTAVNEMIDSVRKVAAEKKLPLIYFSEILEQTHKAGATYQSLSSDSIHLTRMASEILLDQILQKLNIKGYQAKYEFDFTAIDSKYSQYN